ncbi:MAG: TraR/DksA family transcriptional regulator [Deltaproteobacteria bacterium]|nr:TraR/DksA family transcriptional regulator [Deltaproteobacteria bacterium]
MNLKKQEFFKKMIEKKLAEKVVASGRGTWGNDGEKPVEFIDQAAAEFEVNLNLLFKARDDGQVAELIEALERLEQGIYGVCLDCDGEISEKRLKVKPTATLCIDCQETRERRRTL